MKRVGILELGPEGHYYSIIVKAKVLNDNNNQITVFTYKDVARKIREIDENIDLVIKEKNESVRSFFRRIEKQDFDIFIVNTFQASPPYLFFNPNGKYFVHLRNLSERYGGRKFNSVKDFLAYILTRVVLHRADGIIVESENMKDFAENTLQVKKPVSVFPLTLYQGLEDKSGEDDFFRITIPGLVSEKRKDYLEVLGKFENLPKKYKEKFVLELLGGKPKRSEKKGYAKIINKCKKLKERGFNIEYYEKFIPPKKFSEQLSKADILFCPMKPVCGSERCGKSKESGFPFDMINSAKPGLLPREVDNLKELESSTIYFNNYEESFDILISLSENKDKLKDKKREAKRNSLKFKPKKIRKKIKVIK